MNAHQYHECAKKKNGGNDKNNLAGFDIIIDRNQEKYNSKKS